MARLCRINYRAGGRSSEVALIKKVVGWKRREVEGGKGATRWSIPMGFKGPFVTELRDLRKLLLF